MELARVARLIRQISQALAAAHEKGVFHGIESGRNVMILTTSAVMRKSS